jgi:hypothetical protein
LIAIIATGQASTDGCAGAPGEEAPASGAEPATGTGAGAEELGIPAPEQEPRVPAASAQNVSCERASALGFAAAFSDVDAVRLLLDEGVGVNCISNGQTPLILASRWNKPDIVRLLLERGADPDIKTVDGYIAIEMAASDGYSEVTGILAANMGIPDPLAPKRRAGAVSAPAPDAPAPASDAPAAAPGTARAAVPIAKWVPFGTYQVGDRVQFLLSTGWRPGTVRELGPAGDYSSNNATTYERKYRISDDRYQDAGDWYDWGGVAGLEQAPFWTGFFIGDWVLGEVMAVNSRTEGRVETTEYSYHSAAESLQVRADGSFSWKTIDGNVAHGRWVPSTNGPGIVLKAAVRGRDWAMHNETNATEENIRGIETARLSTEGIMSVAAKRPIRR